MQICYFCDHRQAAMYTQAGWQTPYGSYDYSTHAVPQNHNHVENNYKMFDQNKYELQPIIHTLCVFSPTPLVAKKIKLH